MPLVVSGPDARLRPPSRAPLSTRSLLRHASVAAARVDDPSDSIDVVTAFVDRLETFDGVPAARPLAVEDHDLDAYPDTHLEVPLGSTLCFRIVASATRPFSRGATTQTFPAILALALSDAAPPAASLPVVFLVPPG